MITYRLADSLPTERCSRCEDGDAERQRVETILDHGLGSCILRRPEVAAMIITNWRQFDGSRYRLHAYVVMPNHVHLVATIHPERSLSSVVHSWKSYSAHRIRCLANMTGRVWQPEYWDRFIRDDNHFIAAVEYVEANPVNAGLVTNAEAWPFSSATRA